MNISKEQSQGCCVEIYYPYGMRMMRLPEHTLAYQAALEALDIWEGEKRRYRVRALRTLASGGRTCVCQFPPEDEPDA